MMDDQYLYAIEYFDADSSGSQWDTVSADCIGEAVKEFKRQHPFANIYDVFVQHRDASEFIETE